MKILQGQYPPLVPPPENGGSISYEMINLITWLLQKDPLYRPSIRDLLCEVCEISMYVCMYVYLLYIILFVYMHSIYSRHAACRIITHMRVYCLYMYIFSMMWYIL